MSSEAPGTIEPARIDAPDGELPDLIAEVAAKGEALGQKLHPRTAENLTGLVRIMNTYYSNLIEGHNRRPRDIERALARIDEEDEKRDVLIEAVAHGCFTPGVAVTNALASDYSLVVSRPLASVIFPRRSSERA